MRLRPAERGTRRAASTFGHYCAAVHCILVISSIKKSPTDALDDRDTRSCRERTGPDTCRRGSFTGRSHVLRLFRNVKS